jgi:hypothetical protein
MINVQPGILAPIPMFASYLFSTHGPMPIYRQPCYACGKWRMAHA